MNKDFIDIQIASITNKYNAPTHQNIDEDYLINRSDQILRPYRIGNLISSNRINIPNWPEHITVENRLPINYPQISSIVVSPDNKNNKIFVKHPNKLRKLSIETREVV